VILVDLVLDAIKAGFQAVDARVHGGKSSSHLRTQVVDALIQVADALAEVVDALAESVDGAIVPLLEPEVESFPFPCSAAIS
jgi:hypothetical protein